MTGQVLDGRYRLVAPIGRGGMSVVWRGHDDLLSRPVAVKVLSAGDAAFVASVRREATALAQFTHPHIATVYDYGEDTSPYIVMELVDGESLAQVLRRGPLAWPTAIGIVTQVAAALAAAHAHGVVHRDITPANVMLCADGAKVIDFGIAAPTGDASDRTVFGTPAYLAPERIAGNPALPATDVYGLGLLGYEALTGHLPWPSATATQMVAAHRHVPPHPLPPIPGLPAAAVDTIRACLSVDPAARPSSLAVYQALAPVARAGDPRRGGVRPPPAGPRLLAHPGATVVDTGADTVDMTPSVARAGRDRALSFLPTILLVLLIGGLGLARLPTGDFQSRKPSTRPSAPTIIAAPPPVDSHKAPRMPAKAACHVDFAMTSQWFFGFTAQLSITNRGTVPIKGWSLRFALAGGLRVGGGWNGRWTQSGRTVTVRDMPYNATVPAGGSITLGFLGTAVHGGITSPTRFTLNGATCR